MAGIQEQVDTALRAGDYFRAYDLATSALDSDPTDFGLQYSAVLALARTGANYQARARLSSMLNLANPKNEIPLQLAEDFAAMDARLLKNLALEEIGEKRRALAARSAQAYEFAYTLKAGHYPAINAATMWLIAEEPDKSRKMALAALTDAAQQSGYWPLASTAEAHLLLGQPSEARKAFANAMASSATGLADKAVTRRQMAVASEKLGVAWSSIDIPPQPIVVSYCSDDFGELASDAEDRLSNEIERLVAGQTIESAFGSIRNEVELFVTERLLDHGIDVVPVLPANPESIAATIGGGRHDSRRRIEACIEKLRGLPVVMTSNSMRGRALFSLTVRCAMGLAVMRSRHLMIESRQFLIRHHGMALEAVQDGDFYGKDLTERQPHYENKAFIFCDIKGFSKISENDIPTFVELVLGGLAEEINKYQTAVEYKETAGDGIYIVLRGVVPAAGCALALAKRMENLSTMPLPPFGIRVSAHVGSVFSAIDPVTGLKKFFGSEIIRTARIEPITPVGECYVTEQFASILALEAPDQFNCDYAGVVESAKGYGAFRMYSLREHRPLSPS